MVTERLRYVDKNAVGLGDGTSWANAYVSVALCIQAEATDLVTADVWLRIVGRGDLGTHFVVEGYVPDIDHYIIIEAESGQEAVATGFTTSRAYFDLVNFISINETDVEFKGIQFRSSFAGDVIYSSSLRTKIDSCYFEVTGATACFRQGGSGSPVVKNSIFYNGGTIIADSEGIYFDVAVTGDANHNIVYGFDDGIESDTGVISLVDNAVFNNNTDFDNGTATVTIDHCASDDGDGTNAISASGLDWENEFVDPANGDFTPLLTGNIYHGGIAISGVTTDMSGNLYYDPPTVGANEVSLLHNSNSNSNGGFMKIAGGF